MSITDYRGAGHAPFVFECGAARISGRETGMLDRTDDALNTGPTIHTGPVSGWTDERRARVKYLWEVDGYTASQIAADLGGFEKSFDGGRNAVIGIIHRNGWSRAGGLRIMKPRMTREERLALQNARARALTQTIQRAPKMKAVPFNARETVAEFMGLPLFELTDGQCRYPRDSFSGTVFCGQPVVFGHSWCGSCCRIVYQPPKPRTDKRSVPL